METVWYWYFRATYFLWVTLFNTSPDRKVIGIYTMENFERLGEELRGLQAYEGRSFGSVRGVVYFNRTGLTWLEGWSYMLYLYFQGRAALGVVMFDAPSTVDYVLGSSRERGRLRALFACGFQLKPFVGCERIGELLNALGVSWDRSVIPPEAQVSQRRDHLYVAVTEGGAQGYMPEYRIINPHGKTQDAVFEEVCEAVAAMPDGFGGVLHSRADGGALNSKGVTVDMLRRNLKGRKFYVHMLTEMVQSDPKGEDRLVVIEWKHNIQEVSARAHFEGGAIHVDRLSVQRMSGKTGHHEANDVATDDAMLPVEPDVAAAVRMAVQAVVLAIPVHLRPKGPFRVDTIWWRDERGVVHVLVTEINNRVTATDLIIDCMLEAEAIQTSSGDEIKIYGRYLVLGAKVDVRHLLRQLRTSSLAVRNGIGVQVTAPGTVPKGKVIVLITGFRKDHVDGMEAQLGRLVDRVSIAA